MQGTKGADEMKGINIIKLTKEWLKSVPENMTFLDDKGWHYARPIGLTDIKQKIKAIILIIKGKADLLIWPEDY